MDNNIENAQHLADAVISEIKAEMGRQNLSSRGLGRLIDKTSQYMSMRLDGGNPRTGERVPLSVSDLAAIASALGVSLVTLLNRADAAMAELHQSDFDLVAHPYTDETGELADE